MFRSGKLLTTVFALLVGWVAFVPAAAQEKSKKSQPQGKPVMWERVDISGQDLYLGPGGVEMQPDVTKVTFIKEEKGGNSKKFRIKDAAGREWVAKVGNESQAETAAVRLLAAIGYKTEINYLVSSLNIPGQGTFSNVRLEARPENIERLERWQWDKNPFAGTNELQGLKILMALLNNWDLKDGNNMTIKKSDEMHYIVSDLGATFGSDGGNNLPIFWRFGRSKNNPADFVSSDFIKEIEEGRVEFSFKGKGMKLFDDITVEHGRWLADLLTQLSDKQIEDAFRAANYSPEEIKMLSQAVKNRITALDQATRQKQVGNNN
ncbi:MAG: hypothetical protein M3209_09135 [Acidobacteriota bacterium]|nr:hypothetical protein [Acidobacteriota bacterium]